MTAKDVIETVRFVLGDVPEEDEEEEASPRWSDAELLSAMNRGGRMLMKVHSETRLTAAGALTSWVDADDADDDTTALALDDGYLNALVHATAAGAYEGDAADKHDREMAAYHRNLAEAFFRPRG